MEEKGRINVAFIGHCQSGKSTMMGHLAYLCGMIPQREVDRLGTQTHDLGRTEFSLRYAWWCDRTGVERERGGTIRATVQACHSERYQYSFVNVPGHRDFTKNMITGISQAHAAVLLVSAPSEEFGPSVVANGATWEHARIAFTMGVKQLVVGINKMDVASVNYSAERYDRIQQKVSRILRRIGYHPHQIAFIPLSGAAGDNMTERSLNTPWWGGPTLLEALDALTLPPRPVDKSLRIAIRDKHRIRGIGSVLVGRVESGILRPGMCVALAPSGVSAVVASVERHWRSVAEALPGDIVGFNIKSTPFGELQTGDVAGDAANDPPVAVEAFTAQVIIVDQPGRIKEGYTPVVDCHTTHIPCKWSVIQHTIDLRSGAISEVRPQYLRSGDVALIDMIPQKPMCVENFGDYSGLGRIVVRDNSRIVGVGVIKSVRRKNYGGALTKAAQQVTM